MNDSQARIEALRELLLAAARRDPSVSSRETVLLAAMVFVLVALLVVLFLLAFTPRKRRVLRRRRVIRTYVPASDSPDSDESVSGPLSEDETSVEAESQAEARQRRLLSVLVGMPAMLAVAMLFAFAAYGASGTSAFCTYRCHQDMVESPQVVRVAPLTASVMTTPPTGDAHTGPTHHEDCTGCHRSDIISNISDRTRMITAAFRGSDGATASALVASSNCVRCHQEVLERQVIGRTSKVRMSHKEPYEAGTACVFCHARLGHEGSKAPVMSSCLECHDAEEASSACKTCHVGRPSDQASRTKPATAANKRDYPVVQIDSGQCYKCHDPLPCDSCHRVRLPHTVRFLDGGHAYRAAWSGKSLCYRCHTAEECMDCHQSFARGSNHYQGWEQDHVKASPTAGCSCHDRRNPSRTSSFCTVCHPASPGFNTDR